MILIVIAFSGCGYKSNPYYDSSIPISDENVEFNIKKSS